MHIKHTEMFSEMLFLNASLWQVPSHRCTVDEEEKKHPYIHTSLTIADARRVGATWCHCDHFHFCILIHLYFRCIFGGNILPFSTRFHPFCRKYCKSPKWKPLNSSSLRLTRIDVIASLGLPWKHGAPKNSNTLIQPALGLAWRGWLFVSIHNPSSDSKQ